MARSADAPATATAPVRGRRRGRPPRTETERAEHRARLIDAAMAAVRDRGPDISIDDIAAAAGVSKPVLYDEFGSKTELADAVAVTLAHRIERQVVDIVAGSGTFDVDVAVRAVVDALVTLIDHEPALYAFIVRAIRTSDRGFLDNALVRVIHERGATVVGWVAPGLPPDHLTVLTDGLFGFVLAAVESWAATKVPPKEAFVDSLSTVIRSGLRAVEDL